MIAILPIIWSRNFSDWKDQNDIDSLIKVSIHQSLLPVPDRHKNWLMHCLNHESWVWTKWVLIGQAASNQLRLHLTGTPLSILKINIDLNCHLTPVSSPSNTFSTTNEWFWPPYYPSFRKLTVIFSGDEKKPLTRKESLCILENIW